MLGFFDKLPPKGQKGTSVTTTMAWSHVILYLTADFKYSNELLSFWIAFQGAVEVRATMNKHKTMHWCHALLLSLVTGHGGATFAPLWMGRSVAMLNNDFHVACCIISFLLVTFVPLILELGQTLPVTLVTVMFAQLFRTREIVKYTSRAFREFAASDYYPVPVFAPIAYGTLLGNMGGFFAKSFHSHLEKHGVPWSFQNGLFCSAFYHFFVHDRTGPIGSLLRRTVYSLPFVQDEMDIDNETFALIAVSVFMQVIGILRMPHFLGPTFSPLAAFVALLEPIVKNTVWIKVVPAANRMSLDNKATSHTRGGDTRVETAAKAQEPTEYSITTVAITKMTPDATTTNETIETCEENVRIETSPAKRKWQRWIRKRKMRPSLRRSPLCDAEKETLEADHRTI